MGAEKRREENGLAKLGQAVFPQGKGGKVFQNLKTFNKAFLSKQGWRLQTHPKSLFYRAFKAKYFSDCNFV